MGLNLIFILFDVLILLAYPIVFILNTMRKIFRSKIKPTG